MEQLRWIYKETLNCEGNKAEDSEHEHEAKWKGNAGLWGNALEAKRGRKVEGIRRKLNKAECPEQGGEMSQLCSPQAPGELQHPG